MGSYYAQVYGLLQGKDIEMRQGRRHRIMLREVPDTEKHSCSSAESGHITFMTLMCNKKPRTLPARIPSLQALLLFTAESLRNTPPQCRIVQSPAFLLLMSQGNNSVFYSLITQIQAANNRPINMRDMRNVPQSRRNFFQ